MNFHIQIKSETCPVPLTIKNSKTRCRQTTPSVASYSITSTQSIPEDHISHPSCFLHCHPAHNYSHITSPHNMTLPLLMPALGTKYEPHPPPHSGAPPVACTSPPTPYHPSYDGYMSPSHIRMTGIFISVVLSPLNPP